MSVFRNFISFIVKMYFFEVLFLGMSLYLFGVFIHLSFSPEAWSIYTRIILGALWLLFVLVAYAVYMLKGGKK
ncbi:MAG: hypothetical protein PHF52_08520 [Sulfurospirillaceae bacterium]|nr:hypothetical protein [Sulfurospirillaceae bacterium]